MDRNMERDLKTLVRFVEIYCRSNHEDQPKSELELRVVDLKSLVKRPVELCQECQKLLSHAVVKRSHCPMEPKPACKHCPVHCYHPDYRARIREVMRYSGRKIVLGGRLDYLYHLLF